MHPTHWLICAQVSTISKHPSDRYFGTWLTLFDDFSDFVESGGLELAATACAHFLPALDWVSDPRTGDVLVNDVRRYEGFHAAGITFASLGHRLAPNSYDEGFPDLCSGLACLASNAERFDCDPGRIFVGGHSSGGHYAAQLAVTGDWQSRHGLPRDVIKGCLPISGVYDVSSDADFDDWPPPCLKEGDDGREKSPQYRVAEIPPPFLVTWGGEDYPFLIPQAKEFARALADSGGDVETLEVPGLTHFTVLGDGADPAGEWNRRAVAWITAHS